MRPSVVVSLCATGLILLTGCGTSSSQTKGTPTPSISSSTSSPSTLATVPTSCSNTMIIDALKPILPKAEVINTQWQPAPGTELADVINNGGIACSYGVLSQESGVTVRWVKDVNSIFEKRVAQWESQGFTKVEIPGITVDDAYFLVKPQSETQEFHIWNLNILKDGIWISVNQTYGENLEAGMPVIKAALG